MVLNRTGATGRCFGAFGELLQGALPAQRREFLVSLPITQGSTATFTALHESNGVQVSPSHKEKSRRLAEELMQLYSLRVGGALSIESELHEGKGCASSSADMVATARAIQSAFGIQIPRHTLAWIMSAIEPSDSVMYEGIVSFHQREGNVRKSLGSLPPLTLVALDEGGQVETTELCENRGFHSARRLAEYETLLLDLERAVRRRDLISVGEVATRSALLNQEVLPKQHFDLFLELRARHNALGVVATHSGTCLGLLLAPDALGNPDALPELVSELQAHHHSGTRVYRTYSSEHRRPLLSDAPAAQLYGNMGEPLGATSRTATPQCT